MDEKDNGYSPEELAEVKRSLAQLPPSVRRIAKEALGEEGFYSHLSSESPQARAEQASALRNARSTASQAGK